MRDGGRRRRAGKRERAVSYANGWVAYAERAGRRARTWSEESPSEQLHASAAGQGFESPSTILEYTTSSIPWSVTKATVTSAECEITRNS